MANVLKFFLDFLFCSLLFLKRISNSNQVHFEPLLTTLIWLTFIFLVWRKKNQRFGGFLVAEILGFGLFWIFLLVPMTLLFFGSLDLGLPGFDLDWLAQIILGFFSHFWRLENMSSAFRASGTSVKHIAMSHHCLSHVREFLLAS